MNGFFLLIIFKKCKMKKKWEVKNFKKCKQFIATSSVLLNSLAVSAQDGNAGAPVEVAY